MRLGIPTNETKRGSMSRLPVYCECSKPDSQKHCRIPCNSPRFPEKKPILRISPYQELSDEALERIMAIIQRHEDKQK